MFRNGASKSRAFIYTSLAFVGAVGLAAVGLAAGQVIADQNVVGDFSVSSQRAPARGLMIGKSCPVMGVMVGVDAPPFGDGRIAFLKAELGVTDAQLPAWNAYAEALKRNFESMKAMRPTVQASVEGRNPVDRLDAHLAQMESRLASLKNIKPSLKALYDTLTPEQRKTANAVLTGMGCMI